MYCPDGAFLLILLGNTLTKTFGLTCLCIYTTYNTIRLLMSKVTLSRNVLIIAECCSFQRENPSTPMNGNGIHIAGKKTWLLRANLSLAKYE